MNEQTRHDHVKKGIIDAIVDLGRDLEQSDLIDHTLFDNDGSRQAIIKCVEKRIGKPFQKETPPALKAYMDKYVRKEIYWSEGRSAGYIYLLGMLCYMDCGSGSGRALIAIGRGMQDLYGDENPSISSMEKLEDSIHDRIGSPPAADEGYSDGYVNMLRLLCQIAYMQGI